MCLEYVTAFQCNASGLLALLREFARRLKSKREEFAAKVLQEEQLVKSRKRQQAPFPPANTRLLSLRGTREKLLNYLDRSPASAMEEKPAVVSGLITSDTTCVK